MRILSIVFPPAGPFRPDLGDAAFIACLSATSGALQAAQASLAAGEDANARRYVVEHFVNRSSPKFFCDSAQIVALASTLQHERKNWVAALVARVESDLKLGLSITSSTGAPLAGRFEWRNVAPGPGDDDLYVVQPHRFGFMPRLALAALHGVSTQDTVNELIDRWIVVSEEGFDMCYLSPLVVLYRVIALSWTFAFGAAMNGGEDTARIELLFKILKIIQADTRFLAQTIGDSYANNHLLADGFAGWYWGTLFPEFPAAAASREKGETIFVREMARQFLDDGTSFEHSTHYHELGCEMAAAYVILSRRNGIEPAEVVTERLRRMLAFQAAICGPEAVPLPIGDSTEDPLFPLDAERGWGAGAMRELYRALFDPALAATADRDVTVERAHWLLGGALAEPSSAPRDVLPTEFDRGGFYIMTDDASDSRLVIRSGPVEGEAISAGHAHADLLSIYLSVGGVPLVVDSGTYTYRLKSAQWPEHAADWRSYFAGPDSHNGLLTGADPYGAMSGDFRNRDIPCRVKRLRCENQHGVAQVEFEVTGANPWSGYRRGVVHVIGKYWVVYDVVPDGVRTGETSIALQFAVGTKVDAISANMVYAQLGEARCSVGLCGSMGSPIVLDGSTQPVGGWVSPRYGALSAAPQLRAPIVTRVDPCGFVLRAGYNSNDSCAIVAGNTGSSWIAFQIADGGHVDQLLIRTIDHQSPMVAGDIHFDGSLLWLRTRDGQVEECRRVGGAEVVYRGRRIEFTPDGNARLVQ